MKPRHRVLPATRFPDGDLARTRLKSTIASPFRRAKHVLQDNFKRVESAGRNIRRRATQSILTRAIPANTKRLVVFLTPGREVRTGGVMSIAAIYQESIALEHLHQAQVALCTLPGDPPLLKYTWFENRNYILNLTDLLKRCSKPDYILFHIPEYAINQVLDWLNSAAPALQNVSEVQLNVLLQNIDSIRGQNVAGLKRFGKVTCTTAHEAYTNPGTRAELGVSLHRLATCNGPELYSRSLYEDKEPVLIVSPDLHPMKGLVLHQIAQALPGLRIQIIENLSYNDYRKLVGRAKWSLTFGEGLDAYFVDPVFSGGVSFAVFNERFFTPAFATLETVYPSWTLLLDRIGGDLQRLDEPAAYDRCWQEAYTLLSELYKIERFRENLRLFYCGEYTFP